MIFCKHFADRKEIMTERHDFITVKQDNSQVIKYTNPFFSFVGEKSFYSPKVDLLLPEHWHEELEIIYVEEGDLDFSVNGENFVLNEGEAVLVNSKRIHSNGSPRGRYTVFYYSLINPSYLRASSYIEQKYVAPVLGPDGFDYLILNNQDWTMPILNDMVTMFKQPNYDGKELEIIELELRMLRTLYTHLDLSSSFSSVSQSYVSTFREMIEFIADHYSEKISLEDIANAGNVGKTLCATIFKKLSSKTPGEYLINYRISEGLKMLDDNSLSITDVAFQTGFNSASHFTKTFREMMGCTPNKYRTGEWKVPKNQP